MITIEDPVEQILAGVMQTEVNEAAGLTFAKAAKHLLRQDPEVLVLGEIRDNETANLVVRAALTGHLVISTLHAGSCAGVIERLLLMCPDRYAAGMALSMILNQRLVRRLCGACQGTGGGDRVCPPRRGAVAQVLEGRPMDSRCGASGIMPVHPGGAAWGPGLAVRAAAEESSS